MTTTGRSTRSSLRGGGGGNSLVVKGQAAAVLTQCTTVLLPCGTIVPLSARMKASLLATVDELAGERALRCLALASKCVHCPPLY